jgi:WD40 repeat protein
MTGQPPGRTFISYSRKDGAEYAAWLRVWLEERNLSVWQDIVALEGGRDWWSQIEEALRSKALQHFILVVTPASLESPYVRREIRLARQEGKTVCPVKGPGLDLGGLPRWLGQVYDLDLTEHQTTLIRVLQDVSRQKRVPMMAPEPPEDFVPRPKEFNALKQQLLDAKGDAVAAITAALKGAGGYGKTTLAKALAHDPDIQDAYFDGILWAELGEKQERLLSILTDQIEALTGERPGLETINAAAGKLGEALGDRRILMIVDDAWREPDLRPFLQSGPNCVRLVTTRIDSVLPQRALRQPVDAMQLGEALSLLSAGLPSDQVPGERANLAKLADRLGEWAQLLKIVNGFLRERVVKANESLAVAIVGANRRLGTKGPVAFDPRDETDRAKAVARTIGVSLELLSETERARFGELGVFPEDAEIPVGVGVRLWAATGGVEEFETEDLLNRLYDLSLLLDLDLGQRWFRLHDTVRHFLRDRAGKEGLLAQHKQLVKGLDSIPSETTDARTRSYLYLYLPLHLAEAGDRERLDALLLDPGWLEAKLEATANPQALAADYQRYGIGEAQGLIGGALRLISGICARDARQLPQQLIGRLAGFEAIAESGFLDRARRLLSHPSIVPLRSTLTPPGAETARLEGHGGPVYALCPLEDGRLALGSSDGTIRLWDVAAGVETARLEGHVGLVRALCRLENGRLASGSSDGTIRIWDVAAAGETAHLKGAGWVYALCRLEDERLASGSSDATIRLWDLAAAAETARLAAHGGAVYALCRLEDGRLTSGCDDGAIRLWDVAARAETALLGHARVVTALCLLEDGRLASGSSDGTIRLWELAAAAEIARLPGYAGPVNALCRLKDGRLASGCGDGTIRLWDVAVGAATARLVGHARDVYALCRLKDGRLASGSLDGTIRLWDVAAGAKAGRIARRASAAGAVKALCLLEDRWVASGSDDGTIRLWDAATGAEADRIAGHGDWVGGLCRLEDGRLASSSWDRTIRLWDVAPSRSRFTLRLFRRQKPQLGAETARLAGHAGPVRTLCQLRDGRLASGSSDKTIRLWDVAAGAETARLAGHAGSVYALCRLEDWRLASGSSDETIRLWDVTAGAETARLEQHTGPVGALCLLADGRLASGSDDRTIRLWDVTAGTETARLTGHARAVTALCRLEDGRLASGSFDGTIRLWDTAAEAETARLEFDAAIWAIAVIAPNRIVAADVLGQLHWLDIVG